MLSIEDRLKAARGHIRAGRQDNAAMIFESVLDAFPGQVEALTGLMTIRLGTGDIDGAQALASEAMQRRIHDPNILTLTAKILIMRKKPKGAEILIDQALDLEPGHAESSLVKTNLLIQRGDMAASELLLKQAYDAHPANTSVAAALTTFYLSIGAYRPALAIAQDGLLQDPDSDELKAAMGQCLSELGDHEKAVPYLQEAFLQAPANPIYMLSLAKSLSEIGQLTEAHRIAKRAVARFADLLPAWLIYIEIMIRRDQASAALAEFLPVAKRNPDRLDATLHLGQAYRMAGYPDKTLELLAPVLARLDKVPPEKAGLFRSLARDCYLSTGNVTAARQLLDSALADLPETDAPGSAHHPDALGADTLFIANPELSNLEMMVLMRYPVAVSGSGNSKKVMAAAASGQLLALFEPIDFIAGDLGADGPDLEPPRSAIPLPLLIGAPDLRRDGIDGFTPYVNVPEARRATWRNSFQSFKRPRLALCWDSSRPGILLADYTALLAELDATIVSVVWDGARDQLAGVKGIIDGGVHFRDLKDLAALLTEVDAIIGPDSIPLHLAGALGRPGVVLSSPAHRWYWHADHGRSTWYPSIQVVKPKGFGNWSQRLPEIGPDIRAALQPMLETEPAGC